jgi:hypothetical protein
MERCPPPAFLRRVSAHVRRSPAKWISNCRIIDILARENLDGTTMAIAGCADGTKKNLLSPHRDVRLSAEDANRGI